MADSTMLYQLTRESALKFEYFVLSLTLALVGYDGKALVAQKLGINAYSVEVGALLILVASLGAGLKRIEAMIETSGINHTFLTTQEKRSKLMKSKPVFEAFTGAPLTESEKEIALVDLRRAEEMLSKRMDEEVAKSLWWYRVRMWLLVLGVLGFVSAKVLKPYFP